jgi:putative CocE/NonD family hydrolase
MKHRPAVCLLVLSAVAAFANTPAVNPEAASSLPTYQVHVQLNVQIPMRDGVNLAADIYHPDATGSFPVVLMRTYWGKHEPWKINSGLFFAKRGYVVVLQDVRGRFDSGGVWTPYINEPRDGYDTQMWLGKQSWCNGKIGMFGISYDGFTQVASAPLHSPYVKALIPMGNQQTNFGHLYNDGVLQLGTVFTAGLFMGGHTMQPTIVGVYGGGVPVINWEKVLLRLPLITALDDISDIPWVKEWIRHDEYGDYWASYGVKGKYAEIGAPAYFVTGWYDNLLHETWRNFAGFREQGGSPAVRQETRILVGPWQHGDTSLNAGWDADLGPNTNLNRDQVYLAWFDDQLKGLKTELSSEPPIRIFVMGANKWRSENEWPLARTKWTDFYLDSGGKANSLHGDGLLSKSLPSARAAKEDEYIYDPNHPVPTLGGQIAVFPDVWGARDRRPVQRRDDVLVYTTAPLSEDVEVTGPVNAILYASSSAVDTDFTATLSDVYPDGRAVHICEGIRGARFRESLEHPTLIVPGKVYKYEVSLWETSNLFKAGHRIRLDISSSNFPRFARNQNTGNPFGMSAEVKLANQTIFHNAEYPSHLVLPVIPASTATQTTKLPSREFPLTVDAAQNEQGSLRREKIH